MCGYLILSSPSPRLFPGILHAWSLVIEGFVPAWMAGLAKHGVDAKKRIKMQSVSAGLPAQGNE